MTVKEFKEELEKLDPQDDFKIMICVETPNGYLCPDGCAVEVQHIAKGLDWHADTLLLIPEQQLKLKSEDVWTP